MITTGPFTTSGHIALANLDAQIDGLLPRRHAAVGDLSGAVELLLLRAHLRGSITDGEYALELAQQHVEQAPTAGASYLSRALARAHFHLFESALEDLDIALACGADSAVVSDERAMVLESIGRYQEALDLRRQAHGLRPSFRSTAGLASALAATGQTAEAQRLFDCARDTYRGVSPFPLATLSFRCGHMWLEAGQPRRARSGLADALARVPGYAAAALHLAVADAADGDVDAAIVRVLPFAEACQDPEYADHLGRWLFSLGREREARRWIERAASSYDELTQRFPAAFADHAAEFWLERDVDPRRAVELAEVNLRMRRTERAVALRDRAVAAHLKACRRNSANS